MIKQSKNFKEIPKKLNKEWHKQHPMPKNATFDQRVAWHKDHIQHCLCRSPPRDIAEILNKKKSEKQEMKE